MIEDPDIWCAAKLLVDQHGDGAPLRAAQRVDELLDGGDVTAHAVWRRTLLRSESSCPIGGRTRA
jgi:hypothetical protein